MPSHHVLLFSPSDSSFSCVLTSTGGNLTVTSPWPEPIYCAYKSFSPWSVHSCYSAPLLCTIFRAPLGLGALNYIVMPVLETLFLTMAMWSLQPWWGLYREECKLSWWPNSSILTKSLNFAPSDELSRLRVAFQWAQESLNCTYECKPVLNSLSSCNYVKCLYL